MSKKIKGHVAHKMTVKGRTYFYIVAPERESVEVYAEWPPTPVGYAKVESIHITPRMLGRHGYLQSVLKRLAEYLSGDYNLVTDCSQNDEDVPPWSTKYDILFDPKEEKWIAWKHELNQTALKEDLYEHTHQATQKALNDTIFEEESNMMNHYVLRCKIKSDNDRVILVDEYIQVIQDRNKFTLLFDKADISNEEFEHFINYLHNTLYGRCLYSLYNYKSAEFGNYSVTFSITTLHDSKMARESFLDILTKGIKQHRAYPYRLIDLPSDPSSVEFYIQELGPNSAPIFAQRWREGLNGYVSIKARVYNENGVDVRPYKPLDSDILRFYVRNGRVWLLRYPTTVLETMGAIPETWSKCPQILTTEYRDEDHLIRDCRAVLEHFGMYRNASTVKLCWYPTVNGI